MHLIAISTYSGSRLTLVLNLTKQSTILPITMQTTFPDDIQAIQPIELKAVKSTVKQRTRQLWIHHTPLLGSRYFICGLRPSQLKKRRSIPRPLQTLFSRWRVGEVETCGVYPRHMGWINNPRCHFCGHPCETVVHLLTACPDTTAYCDTHGISFDTLVNETPENILRIAHLDAFIRRELGCNYYSHGVTDTVLREFERKRKSPPDTTTRQPHCKRRKRLVIPHHCIPHCGVKRQHSAL